MKKLILLLIVAVMACACAATSTFTVALAEEKANISDTFFQDGKIGTITDVYYQIKNNEQGKPQQVYMWLTQPDNLMAMFKDITSTDDYDAWLKNYNLYDIEPKIQLDCKLDDNDYQYKPEWDERNYDDNADLPYSFIYSYEIGDVRNDESTYCVDTACFDSSHFDSERGFLGDIIKGSSTSESYFDLENHSLTLRARYVMRCEVLGEGDAENYFTYIYSDWSEEIVIGKNATQIELVKPEEIQAPVISDLTFLRGEEREDGTIDGEWKVMVEFPESNLTAQKYYIVEEGKFQPLKANIEYRIYKNGEWGEWTSTLWGNEYALSSEYKTFSTSGASQDDIIEFRVFIYNTAEEGKNSPYSNVLAQNADKITTQPTVPEDSSKQSSKTQDSVVDDPKPEKDKCKVCGICPVQPLGICLFIWIAIIIIIIVVIVVIKKKKEDDKENNKEKK